MEIGLESVRVVREFEKHARVTIVMRTIQVFLIQSLPRVFIRHIVVVRIASVHVLQHILQISCLVSLLLLFII